tara:strand:- start:612 stop:2060 length:1449 start_codon:yes stop_codon:yes gene_type:complete
MDHHHHRPTTRRQALGEINGNLRGGNTNSKDAVKKGYVGKNFCVSSSKRVKKRVVFILLHHLSRERDATMVFFSQSFPFSVLRGKVPRFSKVRTTYTLYLFFFLLVNYYVLLNSKQSREVQQHGYIRTRSGRTPKAPIQSSSENNGPDVSMAKSSGGGNKSAHTRHNNNNTDPEVDGRENKLGGSSRLAKHDPLQTYSQNLTNKELREVRDIDALDKQNPLAVTEFVNDMFNYWFRVEPLTRVSCNYMRSQTDINHKMRAILVDWLVEVHLKFKLMPETLFLTHNLIDRFLEKKVVSRKNLQLVGVTAMLLASKYEEIWAPEVRDFVYISDKAYTREQIIEMEKDMLSELGFHLTVPTPFHFLSRFFKAAGADKQMQLLSNFLVECALVDYGALKFSNSMLAASCVYVAMRCLNKGRWDANMKIHTRYAESDILECADAVSRLQRAAPTANLSAVYKKYSNDKFMAVAKIAPADGLGDDMNS